ncbi:MAG TPA: DnaD domain protein, partial [Symbiobacteriaceae bacterium]|nr:DnaD domain protein [Symbiobacteriaceae bacterium]
NSFGPYEIVRRVQPHDFDQARALVLELQHKDLLLCEDGDDRVVFSLIPLLSRLRAYWEQDRDSREEELSAGGGDPALAAAEKLLGRPLSNREVSDIQDWVAAYGFGVDMVQAVIREGLRQGVTRMTYLNQVARQWHEEGVQTPEEAEQYIQRYRKSAGKHKAVVHYLGLKRLTNAEQGLLSKWTDDWGFSNEVIFRACDEAAGATNPLQYVNAVLESWHGQGVRTVADAERLLAEHKRRTSGSDPARNQQRRNKPAPARSNVLLRREKKDDRYYDQVFDKFGE